MSVYRMTTTGNTLAAMQAKRLRYNSYRTWKRVSYKQTANRSRESFKILDISRSITRNLTSNL